MPTPNRLQMNLRDVEEKSGPNPKTKGILTCCGEDGFHIRFTAQTVRSLFGHVSLQDGDDGVRLFAVCPACGKSLMVFDSQIDGYDCVMGRAGAGVLDVAEKPFLCEKCRGGIYRLELLWEYPDFEDEELETEQRNDAFSWIWVNAICLSCGRKERSLIDMETA